jgi:hypothetical protein
VSEWDWTGIADATNIAEHTRPRIERASQSQEDVLALDAREISKLRRIIVLAEKLIDESPKPQRGRPVLSRGNGSGKKGGKGKAYSTNWKRPRAVSQDAESGT